MAQHDTEWVRRYWDRSAGMYDRTIGWFERWFVRDGREWVASRAHGDVLEVGVGTGRNLPFYPEEVRLTGVDLSPEMLELARARADELGRSVDLRVGDARRLEFQADSFDTVVFSLALCSIPDDAAAIREAKRMLRPGGRLLLIEHVRSPKRWVRAIERLMDIFTSRLQGDHMLREPVRHLRAEGFVIDELERSAFGLIERASARRPAADTSP
jgi:ubiquinone/menaquinone biosynthesis C-methylase UbiE